MRTWMVALAILVPGASASAHDMWLQPRGWQATPGVPLPFDILVGHGATLQQWNADKTHLMALGDHGAGGTVDLRASYRPAANAAPFRRTFRRAGLHVVSLVSTRVQNDLPSARFNDYLKDEGLTLAIEARARNLATASDGRELYSRRAKALVQVGPPAPRDDMVATRPIGLTLEIVPLRNPYSLGADRALPVKILYEGRPLAGALVKLANLEFDTRPIQEVRSDTAGLATFQIPPTGSWLLNVVWSKPIQGPKADFDTIFSSLTFGYKAGRPR